MSIKNAPGIAPRDNTSYFGPVSIAGIFDQNQVSCVPLFNCAEEANHLMRTLKVAMKGLLTTTGPLTARGILEEFEGTYDFILGNIGDGIVEDLLATMTDVIMESFDGKGTRIYTAKRTEKTKDLRSLISRQRYSSPSKCPSKRNHRQPCSNGLSRGTPVTQTAATLQDKQPKFTKCRTNWMEGRVASTKTIGQFPCKPKANKRLLAGDGPKSDERCCMIADMVREIGQRSEDQTEARCHIDHLKDYYYAETGLALLGKIHDVNEYAVEMALPRYARFWRIMVQTHADPELVRYFIIVRSEGFYPTTDNVDLSNSSLASTQLSETTDRSLNDTLTGSPHLNGSSSDKPNDIVGVAEEPNKTPSPGGRLRIAPRGIGIIQSIATGNKKDCQQRGDNKPCNRLPESRADLHSRRSTPDGSAIAAQQDIQETVQATPISNGTESVAKRNTQVKQTATEEDLEWMKEAKVVELASETGANYFAPLFFVAPHSVILSSFWGNENFERFAFYQEKLRVYYEKFGFISVAVGSQVLGKEYVIRCDGCFARAIYVGQSADIFSFVLLDCHALAHTTDILEMPSSFSSRMLPGNAFLASIRGVKDIPQDLFATIEVVVRPQKGLVGGPVYGEIYYTNKGKTRLVDWMDPNGTGLWFSQFCLDTGAVTDETAPRNTEKASVEKSVQIIKESDGFTFDKEVEDLVILQAGLNLTEDCELPRGCQIDSIDSNGKSVRFSENPPSVIYAPEDITCNTSIPESDSSLVIHDPEEPEVESVDVPEDSLVENHTVKDLLSFLLLSTKFYSPEFKNITPKISDFNANFFRSIIPDKLKREYVFHKMLATIYSFKLIWTGQAEQDALDVAALRVSSWLHEMNE